MSQFIISGFADEISDWTEEQFSYLNQLSIRYFEARGINGKNIADLKEEEVIALKKEMEEHQIRVSSIGSPIGKIDIRDDFEEHLKKLKRVIKTAKMLDTQYIRVFSFYMPKGCDYEQYRLEVIDRLKTMAALAKEEGVILLHENEKGIYGDNAKRCRVILDEVGCDNFKAVFDPANFVQCKQDTKEAYELLKDDVVYLHIKDAKEDGSVVPAGYGIGNVKWILSELIKKDYSGFLSLEPHLGSFHGLQNLEQDDHMMLLEGSTPEKFKLAYKTLKSLLKELGIEA